MELAFVNMVTWILHGSNSWTDTVKVYSLSLGLGSKANFTKYHFVES